MTLISVSTSRLKTFRIRVSDTIYSEIPRYEQKKKIVNRLVLSNKTTLKHSLFFK